MNNQLFILEFWLKAQFVITNRRTQINIVEEVVGKSNKFIFTSEHLNFFCNQIFHKRSSVQNITIWYCTAATVSTVTSEITAFYKLNPGLNSKLPGKKSSFNHGAAEQYEISIY